MFCFLYPFRDVVHKRIYQLLLALCLIEVAMIVSTYNRSIYTNFLDSVINYLTSSEIINYQYRFTFFIEYFYPKLRDGCFQSNGLHRLKKS